MKKDELDWKFHFWLDDVEQAISQLRYTTRMMEEIYATIQEVREERWTLGLQESKQPHEGSDDDSGQPANF